MTRRRQIVLALLAAAAAAVVALVLILGGGDGDDGRDQRPTRGLALIDGAATVERLEGGRWRAALDSADGASLPVEHPVALAKQDDGKLLVAGERVIRGRRELAVVRTDDSGRVDRGFGSNGIVTVPAGEGDAVARGMTIARTGIVLVGDATFRGRAGIAVVHVQDEGRRSNVTSIPNATAAGATATRDGEALVAGTDARTGRALLARARPGRAPTVTRAGSSDLRSTTWRAVAATRDGSAVVVGSGRNEDARSVVAIQRFEPDGRAGVTITTPAGDGDAYGNAVAVSGDRLWVAATGVASDRPISFVFTLDASGGLARTATRRVRGRATAISAEGSVMSTRWDGATPNAEIVTP